ncbi:hypothetical protein [Mucilaginibacter sp.]|uniref:hypothetical protein n=1 Tax=Mucilaginibacter sp. TaxID=1882438 RepID=UPI003D13287E
MEKAEILNLIEQILPKIQQWIIYKEASFEPDEMQIVKQVAAVIQPGRVFNLNCTPCAGELLTLIWSYYQREKNN